jgi:hypothetical protein
MKTKIDELVIEGITYVPKGTEEINPFAKQLEGLDYCIIRGDKSGVFIGYVKSRKDKEIELLNSRNIFYWDGAAGISQLAEFGTSKPENCKLTVIVKRRIILDAIQIDFVTEKSKLILDSIRPWQK